MNARMVKQRIGVMVRTVAAVLAVAGWPVPRASAQMGAGLEAVIKARELSPDDVEAALRTYVAPGSMDDFYMFASGGQAGNVEVYGIPSMRLLQNIPIFSPDTWQGYGVGDDDSARAFAEGKAGNRTITWGDVHHPALSQTKGLYDGQFLFANDKANARIGVVDLRDFRVRQIVKNPLIATNHCGAKITENTEYYVEGAQFGTPLPYTKYAPLEKYKTEYRGLVTFWKFDRAAGRLDQARSFSIELPPYWQDLGGMGKLVSNGWVFINTYNTELATPDSAKGKPAMEVAVSQREMDYLHIINWKKAEGMLAAGTIKTQTIAGMIVIPMAEAVKQGIMWVVGEPKSPHGSDVSPDGRFIVVSGKLDPHVTVYSFDKIQKAITAKSYEGKDAYGIPVLKFKETIEAQVEVGLGPLHSEFDDQGYAYTSLFLDSAIARWSLDHPARGEKPWSLVEKLPVHYNVGHLTVAGGDTVKPAGHWLVSLNKWTLDNFLPTGPLQPQTLELIDISGPKMKLLSVAPAVGEPHYAMIAPAKVFKPWKMYPNIGTDQFTKQVSKVATQPGQERVDRHGKDVDIFMTVIRSHFTPDRLELNEGDKVHLHITNIERAPDASHGFALATYNINLSMAPGAVASAEFTADQAGVFPFYCSEFCSALHMEMMGYMTVKPGN